MANDGINLPLSDQTIRNIGVLMRLSGKKPAQITQEIAAEVERVVGLKIIAALGLSHLVAAQSETTTKTSTPAPSATTTTTYTRARPATEEVAEGLGDEDDNLEVIGDLSDTDELGTVTASDLERDMEVQDPEHEAKGEPGFKDRPLDRPEALFGIGVPEQPKYETKVRRARVTAATDFNLSDGL